MRFLRVVRRFATLLVFVGMLAFTLLTHAVSGLALAASGVLAAVAGVTSVLADSRDQLAAERRRSATLQSEAEELRGQVDLERRRAVSLEVEADDLRGQVELERQRAAGLTTEVEDLRVRGSALQGQLDEAAGQIAELDRVAIELDRRNQALTLDLNQERATIQTLRARDPGIGEAVTEVTFRGERMALTDVVDEVTGSISRRTRRVATTNISSMAGESIPFYGIAIVVASTAFEVSSACQTMRDMYDLQVALNPDSAIPDDRDAVCGLQVPTRDEVWEAIVSSPSTAWEATTNAYDSIPGYIDEIPTPDFGGMWARSVAWVGGWLDW